MCLVRAQCIWFIISKVHFGTVNFETAHAATKRKKKEKKQQGRSGKDPVSRSYHPNATTFPRIRRGPANEIEPIVCVKVKLNFIALTHKAIPFYGYW